jgi:hypothetical protein
VSRSSLFRLSAIVNGEIDAESKSDELRMQEDLHIYPASAKHWPITYRMNSARCDSTWIGCGGTTPNNIKSDAQD